MVKFAVIAEMIFCPIATWSTTNRKSPEIELRGPGRNVGNEQPVLCTAILNLEFQRCCLGTLVVFVS